MATQRLDWNACEHSSDITPKQGAIRILVVDDLPYVREAICALIEAEGVAQIVGQAENGVEALELAAQLQPDLVLMDVNMPVMGGIQAARHMAHHFPGMKIIMMSSEDLPHQCDSCAADGIAGFIFKVAFAREFAAVMHELFDGEDSLA
jgi:two-component system nitrate/nitrite response regulator NarL